MRMISAILFILIIINKAQAVEWIDFKNIVRNCAVALGRPVTKVPGYEISNTLKRSLSASNWIETRFHRISIASYGINDNLVGFSGTFYVWETQYFVHKYYQNLEIIRAWQLAKVHGTIEKVIPHIQSNSFIHKQPSLYIKNDNGLSIKIPIVKDSFDLKLPLDNFISTLADGKWENNGQIITFVPDKPTAMSSWTPIKTDEGLEKHNQFELPKDSFLDITSTYNLANKLDKNLIYRGKLVYMDSTKIKLWLLSNEMKEFYYVDEPYALRLLQYRIDE